MPYYIEVTRVCGNCNKTFPFLQRLTYGPERGQYCSVRCSRIGNGKKRVISLEERFFNFVGKKTETGCILWAGSRNERGYGTIGAPPSQDKRHLFAHRVSYELFVGSIPAGFNVLHRCDNPSCINPTHLFAGTQLDNMIDMRAKNREAVGEKHGNSKLTATIVREARRRHQNGETMAELAHVFGVAPSSICEAINSVTWKHVR